jgi:hypothetical protein
MNTPINQTYDVKKLCRAIGWHETHNCQDKGPGAAANRNNCVGIKPGGQFKSYQTPEDSYQHCEQIWSKNYGRFPDLALARKWSGNDKPQTWLQNVSSYYFSH